ncbi:hypothetical protein SCHPADRAFT_881260 [Schizopora paradoxa]|uniref:BTB domain-containing protein n=1 Tax=Schizopora paradoxa TaxID=27342 RepID=A0A0H2R7D5_9AGAM|nr:hypothetical protein SCHPADRAFT_881260 [Schizopora paradoxa]
MDGETLPTLKKHETLWFEDGNIVLATDVHLYCVHRGVLAKNSTVFKDMLDLANVGSTSKIEMSGNVTDDSWEGNPLVRMIGDSDEDVYHVLMALYDIEFYSARRPTTLPIILSLLRMSTKYNLSGIRNAVKNHLERVYPNDIEIMNDRDFGDLFEDYTNITLDYEFQLLVAAQRSNLKTVIPMLYFECSTAPLDTILKAVEGLRLEKQQIKKFLRGHEHMEKLAYEYGIHRFAPRRYCSYPCSSARTELLVRYMTDRPPYPIQSLLRNEDAIENDELRAAICSTCCKAISETMKAFRLEIYNSIPGLFGLGTWEDTKRD